MFNIKMDYFNLDDFDNPSTIEEGTDETSFGGMNPNGELLKSTVNDYYNTFKETPIGRDYSKFELDSEGILRLRDAPDIDL